MEPGGSSQGLSIIPILSQTNPIPRISLRSNVVLLSHLRLGLPKDLFPVGLPIKIWKALLVFSILAT